MNENVPQYALSCFVAAAFSEAFSEAFQHSKYCRRGWIWIIAVEQTSVLVEAFVLHRTYKLTLQPGLSPTASVKSVPHEDISSYEPLVVKDVATNGGTVFGCHLFFGAGTPPKYL